MQTDQPEAQPLLELRKVSFAYPSMPADSMVIKDVSLGLGVGDRIRIQGRNGTGKTTLLKLITGELSPVSGARLARKPGLRCVYLNQLTSDFLGEALTVREQLAMSLAQPTLGLQPVRARTIDAGLKGLLSAYGLRLEDRLDDFTCELSVGQRQIVALLAVLQRGVDILALDEFTAHMDAASVSTSWQLLEKVKKEKDFAVVFADQSGTAGLKDAVILSL